MPVAAAIRSTSLRTVREAVDCCAVASMRNLRLSVAGIDSQPAIAGFRKQAAHHAMWDCPPSVSQSSMLEYRCCARRKFSGGETRRFVVETCGSNGVDADERARASLGLHPFTVEHCF